VALQYAKSAIDRGMNLDIQQVWPWRGGGTSRFCKRRIGVQGLAAFAERRAPVFVGK